MRIINVYIHPYAEKEITNILEKEINNNTFIIGDLNAHSPEWSTGTPNQRGKEINEFININNLKILNDPKKTTWLNANKKPGSPDIALISKNTNQIKVKKWKIGQDISSDHVPMIIEIKTNPKINPRNIYLNKHWKFEKMDVKGYRENLEKKFKRMEKYKNKNPDRQNKKIVENPHESYQKIL